MINLSRCVVAQAFGWSVTGHHANLNGPMTKTLFLMVANQRPPLIIGAWLDFFFTARFTRRRAGTASEIRSHDQILLFRKNWASTPEIRQSAFWDCLII
jgi:hypothetical protein